MELTLDILICVGGIGLEDLFIETLEVWAKSSRAESSPGLVV